MSQALKYCADTETCTGTYGLQLRVASARLGNRERAPCGSLKRCHSQQGRTYATLGGTAAIGGGLNLGAHDNSGKAAVAVPNTGGSMTSISIRLHLHYHSTNYCSMNALLAST